MNIKAYKNQKDMEEVQDVMQEENYSFTDNGMSKIHENPKQAWQQMVNLLMKNGPTREGVRVERIVTAIVRSALNNPHWEPESN